MNSKIRKSLQKLNFSPLQHLNSKILQREDGCTLDSSSNPNANVTKTTKPTSQGRNTGDPHLIPETNVISYVINTFQENFTPNSSSKHTCTEAHLHPDKSTPVRTEAHLHPDEPENVHTEAHLHPDELNCLY
ncbi:unnamed protein product [Microthlaspi erraticum]|uniref:Uncharacterized protein n=1 Tax=Microthlaspi erraticum TaxID=1685480 RepID=A0A6D2KYZ7_9BRAS|nr:unnamed protein product [Microthlaspi erraticum]